MAGPWVIKDPLASGVHEPLERAISTPLTEGPLVHSSPSYSMFFLSSHSYHSTLSHPCPNPLVALLVINLRRSLLLVVVEERKKKKKKAAVRWSVHGSRQRQWHGAQLIIIIIIIIHSPPPPDFFFFFFFFFSSGVMLTSLEKFDWRSQVAVWQLEIIFRQDSVAIRVLLVTLISIGYLPTHSLSQMPD